MTKPPSFSHGWSATAPASYGLLERRAAEIAAAIAEEIGSEVDYRPVETDGAVRAAQAIADLL